MDCFCSYLRVHDLRPHCLSSESPTSKCKPSTFSANFTEKQLTYYLFVERGCISHHRNSVPASKHLDPSLRRQVPAPKDPPIHPHIHRGNLADSGFLGHFRGLGACVCYRVSQTPWLVDNGACLRWLLWKKATATTCSAVASTTTAAGTTVASSTAGCVARTAYAVRPTSIVSTRTEVVLLGNWNVDD